MTLLCLSQIALSQRSLSKPLQVSTPVISQIPLLAWTLMYQKLSNRLKEQAFLFHKPVSFVSYPPPRNPGPVKCIAPLEHDGLKLSRVINLATCHQASAPHALALVPFAPIQCNPRPVSGQIASRHWRRCHSLAQSKPSSGAASSLVLPRGASLPGEVVLPAHSEPRGGGRTAAGNDGPDSFAVSLTLIAFIIFLVLSGWDEQLGEGQMGKCWML